MKKEEEEDGKMGGGEAGPERADAAGMKQGRAAGRRWVNSPARDVIIALGLAVLPVGFSTGVDRLDSGRLVAIVVVGSLAAVALGRVRTPTARATPTLLPVFARRAQRCG